MEPERTRRLLLGGTALLIAGWLGQMALVAPALLGAVALATLLPLTLIVSLYAAVLAVTGLVDGPGWPFRPPTGGADARDSEVTTSRHSRGADGAAEAD
ncbi:MAG: hypothetical protein ABEJ05_04055 [Haloglomus sp.]